ncbi:MAG: hypothetical protein ABSG66_11215, partial [Stellaceae bacterium]
KAGLALVFVIPLLTLGLGQGWHVPVGTLASLALLAMILARSCREATGKNPALSPAKSGYPRPSSAPYRS